MYEREKLPRFIFAVLFVVFLFFTINNFTITSLQSFIEYISGDMAALGISFGVFTLFAMLFRLVSGRLLESVKDKFVLILGSILILFAMYGYYSAYSIDEIYLMRALHGVGFAFFNVAYYTMLVKAAPESRTGEVIGYANAMNFVTMIYFPYLGSALISDMTRSSFDAMFLFAIIGSIVVVIAGVTLWRFTSYSGNQFEQSDSASHHIIERNALLPTLAIIFVSFDIGVVFSYSPSLAPLHGVTNPGLYLTFLALSQLVSAMIGGPISDRRGYKPISFFGVVLSVLGLLIGSFGLNILTYSLSAVFLGVGISFAAIGFMSLAAVSVPEERKANAMATVTAGWDGGVMIGSLLIGALTGIGLQLDSLLILSAIITFLCLTLYKKF